jgi:hypothetical protein
VANRPTPSVKRTVPGTVKGFRSKAEWKFFFATPRLRALAHRKAHASRPYKSLPARKSAPTLRTAR